MYSGTTFGRHSGWMLGVHQRIDRAAHRQFKKHSREDTFFPTQSQVLHFEGNNGPDGIKRKSPSIDEPWHFINPKDPNDRDLINLINNHHQNLIESLQQKNSERSAFEAAWLAHAIVDGLTPAHHYPLAEKIEELWGKPHSKRESVKEKGLIKGTNHKDTISKNWQYWGGKGVFSQHLLFESGVATAIVSKSFRDVGISNQDIRNLSNITVEQLFRDALSDIDDLNMYDDFRKYGWSRHLGSESRQILVPRIIKTVALAWLLAAERARS